MEADGPYAGAVRLVADGQPVGSVPHGLADRYRSAMETVHASGSPATCRVTADPGERAPWLAILGQPEPRADDGPFLPPVCPHDVDLASGEAERLGASLNSRAKTKVVARVAALVPGAGGYTVVLDGSAIGELPGERPAVRAAADAGYPLTCLAQLRRDPAKGFRATVAVP